MISRLTRRILHVNNQQEQKENHITISLDTRMSEVENSHAYRRNYKSTTKDSTETSTGVMLESECYSGMENGIFVSGLKEPNKVHSREEISLVDSSNSGNRKNVKDEINNKDVLEGNSCNSHRRDSEYLMPFHDIKGQSTSSFSASCETFIRNHPEVFLPGLIIHIIPDQRSLLPLWKSWRLWDKKQCYRAFVAKREHFKEIVVTPYMFLDHLPWRCHHAIQRVVENQNNEGANVNGVYAV